jgi:Helicase associated domain
MRRTYLVYLIYFFGPLLTRVYGLVIGVRLYGPSHHAFFKLRRYDNTFRNRGRFEMTDKRSFLLCSNSNNDDRSSFSLGYRESNVGKITDTTIQQQRTTSIGNKHCNDEKIDLKSSLQRHTTSKSGLYLPYSSAIVALRVYFSINGNLVIPRRYVIHSTQNNSTLLYPSEWHGVDLSSSVYNMKWWQLHVKQRPDRVSELNELGFVWGRLQPEWNIVLEALLAYYAIHGDVMVPNNFSVPHDRQWPIAAWGIPLGNVVRRIRTRHDFFRGVQAVDRQYQLDGLGFVWDLQEHRFQKFYNALRHFAIINNLGMYSTSERTKPLRVPTSFVVPDNDENWPQYLWNYGLGAKCTALRQKGLYVKDSPRRKEILEQLGFRWSGNTMFSWLEVVHAAAIFSKLNNRHLNVPYQFVVPSPPSVEATATTDADWPWPEYLWGLPLGQRMKDIRIRNAYLKGTDRNSRLRQLEALGFVWKPKRGRKPKLTNDSVLENDDKG